MVLLSEQRRHPIPNGFVGEMLVLGGVMDRNVAADSASRLASGAAGIVRSVVFVHDVKNVFFAR